MHATCEPGLLTLRVRRMAWEADGVISLDLDDPHGADLPAFEPGAHVDLHLPDGTIRQYSLCGDPAHRKLYRLGVREILGGRASRIIHRELRPGMPVTVSRPRNNFPLVPAARYLFVAGGIGITPLLPMVRAAVRAGIPWSLLFCTRRADQAPFLDEVFALGSTVSVHAGDNGTRLDVAACLAEVQPGTMLYCCGPDRLMTAVEEATQGWPIGSVQFEWFRPRPQSFATAPGSFEAVCARSGLTLLVPAATTLLDALAGAGIDQPRSCEQGVCGTCECAVLEGDIDHRDSILSTAERAAGRTMLPCVSRAKGPRLVLDL